MAKIISIVNQKGGTGKTTTTINLGAALSFLNKKVLLVDFDPQGNATSGLGVKLNENEYGIYEVLAQEKFIRDAIKKTYLKNLDILPSTESLAGGNIEFVNLENREFLLQSALKLIENQYDYILIDCPPSLGILTINGLCASKDVLVPVQCEYYALEGLTQLLKTINLVWKNMQPELHILGVLLTMHHLRIKLSNEVISEVRKNFPYRVFKTVIPRNIRLAEAPSFGKSIFNYEKNSTGAKAYQALAQEIIGFE
jgi:chromosome partitioning protein